MPCSGAWDDGCGLMEFVLVRVDNRLVHGQILETWIPYHSARCIVIADDEVASDFFRETVIRMTLPREVKVVIAGVEEFSRSHSYNEAGDNKTIILFSKVSDARRAYATGFRFDRLNIGNVYTDNFKLRCTPSVSLGEEDIQDILFLQQSGVKVELRSVPRDKPIDFMDILKKNSIGC